MISGSMKCLCGYQFNFSDYQANKNTLDVTKRDDSGYNASEELDDIKTEIYESRTNGNVLKHEILIAENYDEHSYDHFTVTCPQCATKYPLKSVVVFNDQEDLIVSQKCADKIAPVYKPPMPSYTPNYGQQSLSENYVYNAALTRQNGRRTAQCTNTQKIKFID